MQCNAMQKMQCNTIQYNSQSFKQLPGNLELWNFRTMQCNAIQCNTMQQMQCNTMQKSNAIQYNTSLNLLSNFQATQSSETSGQCIAMQDNARQYNAMQSNAI